MKVSFTVDGLPCGDGVTFGVEAPDENFAWLAEYDSNETSRRIAGPCILATMRDDEL